MEHFIPYGKQNITKDDIRAVEKVLKSDFLTQGPVIEKFENALSKKTNALHSISTNSATSALHLSCLALGLKTGKTLWTSPITFVASANCARYCNANIDFVDIDETSGLISVEKLEEKLENSELNNKLPHILLVVHLGGSSCNMKAIYKLSQRYGFEIIEDASHAIGGSYCSEPIGSCKYSRLTVFSFHPVKIITTGEGGVVTTNDDDLAEKIRDLRSHGIIKDEKRFRYKSNGPWTYEQHYLGFNYRLTDIQAALGLSQLERLEKIITKRNKLRLKYCSELANLPLKPLVIPEEVISACHLFIIRLNNKSYKHHRHVFEELRKKRIGVQLHYNAVHLNPYYRELGFKENDFPNAEAYSRNAISLPLYPELKEIDQHRIIKSLDDILRDQ